MDAPFDFDNFENSLISMCIATTWGVAAVRHFETLFFGVARFCTDRCVSRSPSMRLRFVYAFFGLTLGAFTSGAIAYVHASLPSKDMVWMIWSSFCLGVFVGFASESLRISFTCSSVSAIAHTADHPGGESVLVLRRFHMQASKIIVEHVLPKMMCLYGRYTFLELPGEYARPDEPIEHTIELHAAEPDLFGLNAFLPSFLFLTDYSERLNRPKRLHVSNDDWQASVISEIKNAVFVVVDLSKFSPHVLWEIQQVLAIKGREALIPIALEGPQSTVAIRIYRRRLRKHRIRLDINPTRYPDMTERKWSEITPFSEQLTAKIRNREATPPISDWLVLILFCTASIVLATVVQGFDRLWTIAGWFSSVCVAIVGPLTCLNTSLKNLAFPSRGPGSHRE